ncbi:uncharacterized protein [Hoplias malabaricus]|uniref:uncharacterized protein isoform X2 n=1 Tax=Hoplias malabaricus TaxID=27720 RepID=UPI003461D0E9
MSNNGSNKIMSLKGQKEKRTCPAKRGRLVTLCKQVWTQTSSLRLKEAAVEPWCVPLSVLLNVLLLFKFQSFTDFLRDRRTLLYSRDSALSAMDFPLFPRGLSLRPVLYFTGFTTAAVAGCAFLHRRHKSKRSAAVVLKADHLEDLQELAVTLPVADQSYEDLIAPDAQGPSSRLWIIPRLTLKQVEVTMQHKSVYRGLESEHWWVLTNDFYHLFPEDSQLPPMHFATVKAVAYIKCVGRQISVLTANLSTESTITSVTRSQFLQMKVSKTYRGVTTEDGCFRSSESSSTHILETPVVPQLAPRPLGPPPGFH